MVYKLYKPGEALPSTGTVGAIYGAPKVGKTHILSEIADSKYATKTGPVTVIDAEGGSKVFSHRSDIATIMLSDPKGDGQTWREYNQVIDDLIARKIEAGTVIVDNCSEILYSCRRHVVTQVPRNIDIKDRPDQRDWSMVTEHMLLSTRKLREFGRSSGTNIFFIAWEAPENSEYTGGVTKRDFAFNPALARAFPGMVDFIGYLTVVNATTRRLSFEASRTTAAGFRKSRTDNALKIPDRIDFTLAQHPLVDIMGVLVGGEEWPAEKYGKVPQAAAAASATDANKGGA